MFRSTPKTEDKQRRLLSIRAAAGRSPAPPNASTSTSDVSRQSLASTIHALEVSNCKQAAAAGEGEQEAKGDDTHQQGTFFFVAGGGGGVSIPPRGEEWRRCTKHRSPSTSIPSSPPRRRFIRHREAEVERREAEVAAERTRGGGVDATTSRRKR